MYEIIATNLYIIGKIAASIDLFSTLKIRNKIHEYNRNYMWFVM